MLHLRTLVLSFTLLALVACDSPTPEQPAEDAATTAETVGNPAAADGKHIKPFRDDLPTIGLLMYDGVLQSEVVATSDVFGKPTEGGERLFNVVTIAETTTPITTEEGLKFVPDYQFADAPALTALFVPSAYDMYEQVHNEKIVEFIRQRNEETTYTVSNCAGAQLIGASGIADGHEIVTWIGGGEQLQIDYPNLKVQDDSQVTYVEDGKFSSSNGNLASYVSALHVLEKMSSADHRKFVASYLYLERLQDYRWEEVQ